MAVHTVAVLNSADDVIKALREALEAAGFDVVTAHVSDVQSGNLDLVAFVEEHNPTVFVYDLPRPLERHWNFLRLIRTTDFSQARCWVLTTVDQSAVKSLVGENVTTEIVLGQPRSLADVVNAVRECLTRLSVN